MTDQFKAPTFDLGFGQPKQSVNLIERIINETGCPFVIMDAKAIGGDVYYLIQLMELPEGTPPTGGWVRVGPLTPPPQAV